MIYQYTNLFCATTLCQVKAKEQELKHKLRPANAFLKAKDLNLPAVVPREELHQFLIGVYGEYVIPSCLHSYMQVLRAPSLYRGPDRPVVSDARMRALHLDTPQRSIEFVGLLLNHGRSHFSVCNTFH
jgi:hypothetical protein